MDRANLSQRITSILSDISRLNNALYALNMTDIQRYPENYEVLCTDAALRGEWIACRLRHLIYATTRVQKEVYLASAAVLQGIEIETKNDILMITLPCVFPKRKQRQSTEYLLDPFYNALSQYVRTHPIPRLRHCVVCFSHIYAADQPLGRIRDYDNLELKQFLDVAASFVMTDDGGLSCDTYHTTELGDADCTRIFIMDRKHFPEWVAERAISLQSASNQ